jgi:hypothetical protein
VRFEQIRYEFASVAVIEGMAGLNRFREPSSALGLQLPMVVWM